MADQQPTRDEAETLYGQMTVADLQAELGERNLATTGLKPELVGRLLDADFPPAPADGVGAPPAEPPADETPVADDGELCPECWPDGWPGSEAAATCEHGTWTRWEPEA